MQINLNYPLYVGFGRLVRRSTPRYIARMYPKSESWHRGSCAVCMPVSLFGDDVGLPGAQIQRRGSRLLWIFPQDDIDDLIGLMRLEHRHDVKIIGLESEPVTCVHDVD